MVVVHSLWVLCCKAGCRLAQCFICTAYRMQSMMLYTRFDWLNRSKVCIYVMLILNSIQVNWCNSRRHRQENQNVWTWTLTLRRTQLIQWFTEQVCVPGEKKSISVGLKMVSAPYQKLIYAVYDFFFFFSEHYLINCVIIRLLMRQQNATWTSGQPAGNVTISLRWHQTSVWANAKLSHYKPSRLFISERNTNNCLIVIGLLQVAHAERVAMVWIMKTHYGMLLKSVHKLLPK